MRQTLIQHIASTIDARQTCHKVGNDTWYVNHGHTLSTLATLLPSGSGIDCGTSIDVENSTGERIVLGVDFHHMDENGGYDGWSSYTYVVTASLCVGLHIAWTHLNDRYDARDDEIQDYLQDVLRAALETVYDHTIDGFNIVA